MKAKGGTVKKIWVVAAVFGLTICIAGCAPNQASQAPDSQGSKQSQSSKAGQAAWSMSNDCATCHKTQGETMTSGNSGACIHATKAQTTCTSCHTDEGTLAKVHEKATSTDTMPKRLDKTVVSADACQNNQCHNLSKTEFVALTANAAPLTDSEGKTVNAHEAMELTPSHSEITCGSCHTMHSASTEVDAKNVCLSCHHANVFTCNTCH